MSHSLKWGVRSGLQLFGVVLVASAATLAGCGGGGNSSSGSGDDGTDAATADGSQYFVDDTDPANSIWGVIAPPQFSLWGDTYTINVNTTLADGVTSRYTLVFGDRSFLFDNANQVTGRSSRHPPAQPTGNLRSGS